MVTVQAQGSVGSMRGMVPRIRELGVIANPLPPELPDRALAARVRDARGRYRLMAMGRLVPAKQFDLLIGAFAELAGEFPRSEEHTSELQSLMRISYAVFCLKK